jgi:hypothetical protein
LIAVLHTWGQSLVHHPHLHCIVPGGGFSLDGKRWVGCRSGYFLSTKVTAARASLASERTDSPAG